MKTLFSKSGIAPMLFAAGLLLGGATTGTAMAYYQSHMVSARNSLGAARAQLAAATHNKGGHRTAAYNLVNQAISQVNQGIRWANNHPGDKH